VLRDALDAAEAAGDRRLAALATVELAFVSADLDASLTDSMERGVRDAIEVFTESADDLGLSKAWQLLGEVDWFACRFGAVEQHYGRALSHAERAHDRRQRSSLMLALAVAALLGPTPVDAAIERCESMLSDVQADRILGAGAAAVLGVLNAMAGRFAEARRFNSLSISTFSELGLELRLVGAHEYAASSALLADDLEAAEHELRLAYESLTRLELRSQSAGIAAMLSDILCRRGKFDEAGLSMELARAAAGTDVLAQVTWRRAAAKIAAANGDFETAIQTLREAAAIVAQTDAVNNQGDLHVDFADVLLASGGDERATRAELETALALYRRKENVVSIARTEAALEAATATPS
jgi:tetratricopeptide (TPR) repeat protein